MSKAVDKRGILEDEIFTYRVTKDKKVFISWRGKRVMILQGKTAEDFLLRIMNADGRDAQFIMAKATGNFKRGNEKQNKRS